MGRRNPLKRLFGNPNNVKSEIVDLPYSLNGDIRELLLKIDVNDNNALAIANVPYYIDGNILRKIFSDILEAPLTNIQFITSTAPNNDMKSGYRSGRIFFNTIQDKRRAFETAKLIKKEGRTVELEKFGVKLPAWHNLAGKALKREHNQIGEDGEELPKAKKIKNENNDDWTLVTSKHKFSFRGKINQNVKGK
ncbi:unnamed protein product [Meloidogyne enterolobii]|uniref:Uncharacterized protein n=2 Tax=Meloidogyne enterolobii TaxID=390850 RepID=A0A6V7XYM6_MELEN|nr:unnamed protein product [Meloidogyne enterolobii]